MEMIGTLSVKPPSARPHYGHRFADDIPHGASMQVIASEASCGRDLPM
jgi:hypothetical protein